MGTAKNTGFIAIGTDLAAVDSTCSRTMEIPIEKLLYIRMAGQVVGNIDPAMIDIKGASIDSLKQKFELPITFADAKLLKQADRGAG